MKTITLDPSKRSNPISPNLYGAFFEDINYGGDGGLYAELVANRSFSYYDREGRRALHTMCWDTLGDASVLYDFYPVTSYSGQTYDLTELVLRGNAGAGLRNAGYCGEGFCLSRGKSYRLRVIGGAQSGIGLEILVTDRNGRILIRRTLELDQPSPSEKVLTFAAMEDCDQAFLSFRLLAPGEIRLRFVSLFPEDTFHERENGLRRDLAERLQELAPRFLRFPGGCIVEGRSLSNMYNWKDTIGPVEQRRCNWNRWQMEEYQQEGRSSRDYFQSYGLGFLEYYQLCEDLGAQPLPVINCGLTCQWHEGIAVPMNEMEPFVQDALDLIEFANGEADTKWGAVRHSLGHPDPFGLTMLGIGNEQWGEVYYQRYEIFERAIHSRYPEIKLIFCAGWNSEGREFEQAMDWLREHKEEAYAVDEHFYRSPQWFLEAVHRYDRYDRTFPEVFVGEYAAHTHSQVSKRENNWYAALTEAAFLTGVENNGDHVCMTCYAPLFGREGHQQWQPNLIWFDGKDSYVTPSYHVQRLFSRHVGQWALTVPERAALESDGIFLSASVDEEGRVYLKLVNSSQQSLLIHVQGIGLQCTEILALSSETDAHNSFDCPEQVCPVSITPSEESVLLPRCSLLVLSFRQRLQREE